MSEWGTEKLDLAGYLDRIGVTTSDLEDVHAGHLATFPFENLDVVLGKVPALDLPSLQDKMVRRSRGGYCYEHNLLYAAALERLGFGVTRLAARVRLGSPEPRARSHMMLLADVDGEAWLTDAGWGGGGLLKPMPLRETTVRQGAWTYRLVREQELWVLQSRKGANWFDLYAFAVERQHAADYELYNWFNSTSPQSPFVGQVVVQVTGPETRRTLVRDELTVAGPDGVLEKRTLTQPEVLDALRSDFAIELREDELDHLAQVMAKPHC